MTTAVSGRRRRRTWHLSILVLLLVAGSAGGGGYFYWRSHHARQLADPTTVTLPAQSASSSKVRTYFAHGGKGLLVLLHHSQQLPGAATRADCLSLAKQLSLAGTPRGLTDAAVEVPDRNLSAAAVNHVQSVINYLGRCGTQPKLTTEAQHAAFTATVLSRMLARDGIG